MTPAIAASPSGSLNDQLISRAGAGDLEGVARLLALGADARDEGSQALVFAAHNGHVECVKLLIPVSDPKAEGSRALRWTACNGHAECVKQLIPISDPKAGYSTALRSAASLGHAECVRLLIPVSDPMAESSYALCWAARKGYAECVRLLIPVSDPRCDDSKALRWAVASGHAECVKLLLPSSLIECHDLGKAALSSGDAGVLSVAMAYEPHLLDGIDLAAALASDFFKNRFELAALLQSIIERRDLSLLLPSPAAPTNPVRL